MQKYLGNFCEETHLFFRDLTGMMKNVKIVYFVKCFKHAQNNLHNFYLDSIQQLRTPTPTS